MGIKHQPQSEKHPFLSPTTAGLYVDFRNYVIELVCLNVNKRIGARFWSDPKYWGSKYRREIKGMSNLGKELDLTDTLTQTALIQIVKEYYIKALVAKKTIARVVKFTRRRIQELKDKRIELSKKQPLVAIDSKKNSTFVDSGEKTALGRIKEIENG